MTKRIDIANIAPVIGTLYPPPFDKRCCARERKRLGDAASLTQFGVNLLRLPPRTWSSQRHWHTAVDEFVYVVSGEVELVTDEGSETLHTCDAAGFKAGDTNRTFQIRPLSNVLPLLWRQVFLIECVACRIGGAGHALGDRS
jgi:uncharacterized cupin superfamily protein